ncbi:NAD(P)/FAD-dependent oxidoreductase [Spiroplasma diminutum]|uniref:Ferredoxin--NADP reductase n=1 Tax=Spiroplasma diminutum CUAS-1 TaxID=1276221 RepID=S5M1E2_9MOLU|nr:NAD(P)/FAD-dependent oxidoreductase [Spiroplasma diminutum]AGR41862.1 thioredoxin reductase [Spiroplasma diminutum CUAS-1]
MIKDILIIGCGSAGLYAWKMAADLKLTGDVVEAKDTYGGQVSTYYPEKYIYNFPAIPKIQAQEAMDKMFEAIKKEDENIKITYNIYVLEIKAIEPEDEKHINWFEVKFSNREVKKYKRILFTDGIGVFKPMQLVEKLYDNIFYSVTNIQGFKDHNVLIFGGGDSSLDWANELTGIAKSVSIIHRRDEFRAKPASIEQARNNNINFLTPYNFVSISQEDEYIAKKLKIVGIESKEELELEFDSIIVQFGQTIEKEKFENLDLKINKLNRFEVDYKMETSVQGIYAAGDCCVYETKVRNLVSCAYEAMQAVINIEKIIKDRKVVNNGW